MISLIAKLRMNIFGTVRMSLLHVIMMRRMTLPVVPNIKGNAYIGAWYCAKKFELSPFCSVFLSDPVANLASVTVSVYVSPIPVYL
jgi:hypothetical protein